MIGKANWNLKSFGQIRDGAQIHFIGLRRICARTLEQSDLGCAGTSGCLHGFEDKYRFVRYIERTEKVEILTPPTRGRKDPLAWKTGEEP